MLNSLPNQPHTAHLPPASCNSPENRLMLAVLQDALATFQRGLSTSACNEIEAFREVDRWFRSCDFDSPFSFENICSTLGIAPRCIRDGLNRMKHEAFTTGTVERRRKNSREPVRTFGEQLG